MNRGSLLQRWPGSRAALSVTATYPYFTWATVDLNFATNYGYQSGTVTTAAALITTTRASTAWAPNASSVYSSFSSNTPRITNLGLLTEEARTNSLPNNTGTGASPGVDPTGWTVPTSSATATVTGTGTEDGIDYVAYDLTFTGAAAIVTFRMTGATTIAAADAQAWSQSAFVKITGGSLTNLNAPATLTQFLNSGGTPVQNSSTPFTPTTASLGTQRYSNVVTSSGATITNVRPAIQISSTGDAAISLRIGWPQMELGEFVTSPIRTTSAAAARNADVVSLTTVPTLSDYTVFVTAQSPDMSGTRYFVAGGLSSRQVYSASNNTGASSFNGTNILTVTAGSGGWSTGGKAALGVAGSSRSIAFNNGTVAADAFALAFPASVYVGGNGAATFGSVTTSRVVIGSTKLDNNTLKAITA